MVVDAVSEEDLRVLATALVQAESAGSRFLYRVGHGLVAVGSHVGLTTRQLAGPTSLWGHHHVTGTEIKTS